MLCKIGILLLSVTVCYGAELPYYAVKCNEYQANFNMSKVVGAWYVVAIIPERDFPNHQEQVTCYKVEFSETEVSGLRWLVNRTFSRPPRKEWMDRIKGTVVRQRYHSIPPFDVWSKNVEGVNGCFQQVLSLDTDKSDINDQDNLDKQYREHLANAKVPSLDKAMTHEAMMQLHIVETKEGPFLLQFLWGKMISVVVYRKTQFVTPEQLQPVTDFVRQVRGSVKKPKICDRSLKDLLGLRV